MADWPAAAQQLAVQVTAEAPEWYDAVAATPRHRLVPRWWEPSAGSYPPYWQLITSNPERPYSNETLVTQVGPLHADLATEADHATGAPTSSSTLPGLIVDMLHLLDPQPGQRVLDVGTGSGYSAALLGHRLGDDLVTSIDREPYLVRIARERLAGFGRTPTIEVADATEALPGGRYDRLMATVSVRPIPRSWLDVLRPGGRIVTTIAQTSLLISADLDEDGTARGRVQPAPASFMRARQSEDYPERLDHVYAAARDASGEESFRVESDAVPDLWTDWQLRCMYELESPDIEHRSAILDDGSRVMWLLSSDGSWARAEQAGGVVHQSGSRRLWEELDRTRSRWYRAGQFPVHRLSVEFGPERSVLVSPDKDWQLEL